MKERFVRFLHNETATYGRICGDEISILQGNLFEQEKETGNRVPYQGAKLLPPCVPSKILAVGFNYRDHAEEFDRPIPQEPNVFIKPNSSLIAHGDAIIYPKHFTKQVEFEAELVVVIGKTARHVSQEDALSYVFGYTVGNDVTARDMQSMTGQWSLCKGFDTFTPLGPEIVTGVNPKDGLSICAYLNGEKKQNSNTRHLIFDVPFLVSYLSKAMTLNPGDVIFTGTPSGVAPIKEGDTVCIEIEEIGALENPIILERS